MAVTLTTILAGTSRHITDIIATAAGDITSGNIAHGLGAIPLSLVLTPLALDFFTKTPFIVTADITNLVVTMVNAGGVAGPTMRIEAAIPHSLTS